MPVIDRHAVPTLPRLVREVNDPEEQHLHERQVLFVALPKFLTIEEVGEIARAPRSSVLYWIYSGKLKAYKVGRRRLVSEQDLMAFISQRGDAP